MLKGWWSEDDEQGGADHHSLFIPTFVLPLRGCRDTSRYIAMAQKECTRMWYASTDSLGVCVAPRSMIAMADGEQLYLSGSCERVLITTLNLVTLNLVSIATAKMFFMLVTIKRFPFAPTGVHATCTTSFLFLFFFFRQRVGTSLQPFPFPSLQLCKSR